MKLLKRTIRLLAGLLVGLVALTGGPVTRAHQYPEGCVENQLDVGLLKDKTSIVSGETVTFTVTVRNDAAAACDVTGANITFHCPAADGTPTGTSTVCAANADFPVPFAEINLCQVQCIVNSNAGVTSAQAMVEVSGTVHLNPDNDDTVDIHRTLSVTIRTCGDGVVGNTTGETCDPPGSVPTTPAGNTNVCRSLGPGQCTYCGDGIVNDGETCDDGNRVDLDSCGNQCSPIEECSVIIAKTVAPDDGSGGGTACDGVADGPFVESVTVDQTACVVYQICVANTGFEVLNGNGVKVGDPVLGTVNLDYGTITPGQMVCKQTTSAFAAPNCTGGNTPGTSCLCSEVAGVNTATITSVICPVTHQDACSNPGSDCDDTASVGCLTTGSCRMTGGHNFDVVDAEFQENGKIYTTGGQIGAPNESGCCDLPPKGKCVSGQCTGGLNSGQACLTNDQCPDDPGRNSRCPWGNWEHNHHSGPDDSGSVTGGSFAFQSGTAAAPNEAFIKSVLCADPGWCVQARPAPFKQIFWEGTGVFLNAKAGKSKDAPLPIFGACGANQPVLYSNKTAGTLHYYKAHVGDFGEPAGIFQKPADACSFAETCANHEPNQLVEISRAENVCPSALGDVCLVDAAAREKETLRHRICQAQTCSECPDLYEIEIHCTADPSSPIAYRVSHFIREGNFQLHPPVGDSCNPD